MTLIFHYDDGDIDSSTDEWLNLRADSAIKDNALTLSINYQTLNNTGDVPVINRNRSDNGM